MKPLMYILDNIDISVAQRFTKIKLIGKNNLLK